MTREESNKLVAIAMAIWPRLFMKYTKAMMDGMYEGWFGVLGEYTYEQALAGLQAYSKSDKNGFPPSPGQVAMYIDKIERPAISRMSSLEAWAMVREAIRDSSYHARERFEEFPPLIQKAVGSPSNLREWGQLTSEQVTHSVQPRFLKAYESLTKQADELMSFPKEIRERLLNIAGKDAMLETTGNTALIEEEED